MGASPSPSATPASPSPGGLAGEVANPAQAAALVLASDPRFAQVSPLTDGLIGASAWYETGLTQDGQFTVSVTLGSGDCPAGCIDRHTWHYTVSSNGAVTLTGDEGDQVEYSPPPPADGPSTVVITAQAGPTCPVLRDPPDSACAPRPVDGAQVVIHAPGGAVVAQATTDAAGSVTVELPAGAYWIEAAPSAGLMRSPPAYAFSVVAGRSAHVTLGYDTGIR